MLQEKEYTLDLFGGEVVEPSDSADMGEETEDEELDDEVDDEEDDEDEEDDSDLDDSDSN